LGERQEGRTGGLVAPDGTTGTAARFVLDGRPRAAYAGGGEVEMRRLKLRRVVLQALLALLAAVAFVAFVTWPRPDRATQESFSRIQRGMSRAEVGAILGPPGDYRSGETHDFVTRGSSPGDLIWETDHVIIIVRFQESGRVRSQTIQLVSVRGSNDPLDKLVWLAKRQWRKWFPE
jgi:hypothetical protein